MIDKETFQKDITNIQNLRVRVSSPCFDDIGEVLRDLKVKYLSFDQDYNCDILFLNCGTKDQVDSSRLKSFVQEGGILYASDWAHSHIESAWPDIMSIDKSTQACKIRASVIDADLRKYIGDNLGVEFDLPAWAKITKVSRAKVLIQSKDEGFPIMIEYSIGKGKIFYTSFHNHTQTSEVEKKLLQLLVIKQISAAADVDFQKTLDIMSLSPSELVPRKKLVPQIGQSSNITDKWKKGNNSGEKLSSTQADDIGSKWRK